MRIESVLNEPNKLQAAINSYYSVPLEFALSLRHLQKHSRRKLKTIATVLALPFLNGTWRWHLSFHFVLSASLCTNQASRLRL